MTKLTCLATIVICFSVTTYAENAIITPQQRPTVIEDTQPPTAEGPLPANQIYPLLSENNPSQISQKKSTFSDSTTTTS